MTLPIPLNSILHEIMPLLFNETMNEWIGYSCYTTSNHIRISFYSGEICMFLRVSHHLEPKNGLVI